MVKGSPVAGGGGGDAGVVASGTVEAVEGVEDEDMMSLVDLM
ncbi:hypothetical protein KSS87_004936 [Heliosperma pusillum]|nr:hypothetical protein KSS87_022927 [Heliosperma pusillum]KAH9626434.1 hypothetical protein KSS87_004936 [Heliosperma pusillum]